MLLNRPACQKVSVLPFPASCSISFLCLLSRKADREHLFPRYARPLHRVAPSAFSLSLACHGRDTTEPDIRFVGAHAPAVLDFLKLETLFSFSYALALTEIRRHIYLFPCAVLVRFVVRRRSTRNSVRNFKTYSRPI